METFFLKRDIHKNFKYSVKKYEGMFMPFKTRLLNKFRNINFTTELPELVQSNVMYEYMMEMKANTFLIVKNLLMRNSANGSPVV